MRIISETRTDMQACESNSKMATILWKIQEVKTQ